LRTAGANGMNILKNGTWVLGKDYYTAPTCSTCHMGAYVKLDGGIAQNTHNVGDRISWTLRPKISVKLNRAIFADGTVADIPGDIAPQVGQKATYKTYVVQNGKFKKVTAQKQVVKVLSWEDRRNNMKGVCKSCHGMQQVEGFYKQFDSLVVTYNDKFAKPTQKLYGMAKKDGLVKGSPFHSPLGWTWFEIWHHEGRRARHGAAMQGPDYVHWHGLYEVARHFYYEFIPELMKLAKEHNMTAKYEKAVNEILARPEHQWYKQGFGEATMSAIKAEQTERYGEKK